MSGTMIGWYIVAFVTSSSYLVCENLNIGSNILQIVTQLRLDAITSQPKVSDFQLRKHYENHVGNGSELSR